MAAKGKSSPPRSNEIKLVRVFDASVAVVWDAWTDPAQAAHWWGPRGFSITTLEHNFRSGGGWHYTMHGPDGVDYPNRTKYLEIERHRRLVYDHGATDETAPMFRVTVLFSENNGKTTMDMTMALKSADAAETTRGFIKKAGGNTTWDRLAEYLDKTLAGKERFVINRSFAAPIELMYELWTKPEHLEAWSGPKGAQMKFLRADIRPGGSSHYMMNGPNDTKMYGKVAYHTFERPHLIVYSQQFSDEHGGISRHPLAPVWPETMLTTVRFAAEGPEQTRVTLTWEPTGAVTAAELEMFIKNRGSMTGGWTSSFDVLEEFLASRG